MMLSLENAKDILFRYSNESSMSSKMVESVPLWEAGGRVLAVDISAHKNVPAFNRSHVDGYAVLSGDTSGASADNPITLKIIDTISAGLYSSKRLLPGTAMKVFSGAPLPLQADCIIKQEETKEIVLDSDLGVMIKRPVLIGENISLKGEDISAGESLFFRGSTLSPAHMGILAAMGIDPVPVYARPQIGIFSTGNELVDLHDRLQYGQLRSSNLYALAEIIRQAGGIPVNLGLVRDRVNDVLQIYEEAFRLKLPVVISTGGTASGDYDVIKDALKANKCINLFDNSSLRPGAPFVSFLKGQLLIGLSGNPAGAIFAMLLFVFPIISRLAGADKQLPDGRGQLTAPIAHHGSRCFLWGRYEEREGVCYVTPFENHFCSVIKTHAKSNCLIEVPDGTVNFIADDIVSIKKLS